MGKQILLTISILISNRPDTIRKCLDSVQPLLKAVPSELILTDTGCSEQIRSIIEEYTNHIIQFKWCDDFSKARNVGLKQAKGKWFMFLDDDEWFEDTTEMIDFFQSGEYKKYGIGAYSQRNYANREGTSYSDLLVGRMIRLEPDIKFVYSIHECFNRVPGHVKKFNVFVHHYGYVYDTKEALHAHANRNIVPLLKEFKAAPNDMKHALQLSQEYNVIDEYEKSISVSKEAIETAKKGHIENDFCLASLYANVVMGTLDLWRFEEGVRLGEEYMQLDLLDPMAKSLIAVRLSDAYMRKEESEKCYAATEYYWKTYQDYLKDDEKFIFYVTNLTCACFEPYNRSIVLGNGVNAAILLGKEEVAWEWFQAIEIEQHMVYIEPGMVKTIVEKLPDASKTGREYYTQMSNVLLKKDEVRPLVIDLAMNRCRQGGTLEDRLHLAASYIGCAIEHPFRKMIELADAVCCHLAGKEYDRSQVETVIKEYWEHMASHMSLMKLYDFFSLEEWVGLAPGDILEKIPFYVWQRELTAYFGQYSREDAAWWTEKFGRYLPENSIRLLLWRAFVGIYDAIWEIGAENGEPVEQGKTMDIVLKNLKEYSQNRIALCERIYRPEILQEQRDILSEEDQAAYGLVELEDLINTGKYHDAVESVKVLRELLPGLDPVMKWYLEWLRNKMKEQEKERQQASNEFQVLAVGVKLKIRQLMAAGNYEAAMTVAKQLSALVPGDEELQRQIEKLREMGL